MIRLSRCLESAHLLVFLLLYVLHDLKLLDRLLSSYCVLALWVNRHQHETAAIIGAPLCLINHGLRQDDTAEVGDDVGIYRHLNVGGVWLENVNKLDAHGFNVKT